MFWKQTIRHFLGVRSLVFVLLCTSYLPTAIGEYDYIVVGSGSAGSVVAHRLAAQRHSVLLVEAGSAAKELGECGIDDPEMHDLQTWLYPTEFHDGRTFINNPRAYRDRVVHGKLAGGTSMINSCLFTPAGLREFEYLGSHWNATIFKTAYEWLQKSLPVRHFKFRTGIYTELFLQRLIRTGYLLPGLKSGLSEDHTDASTVKARAVNLLDHSGYRRGWWMTADQNYDRTTSFHSLVEPYVGESGELFNLEVWLNAPVQRVLWAEDSQQPPRAVGVEVLVAGGQHRLQVMARREVIIAAGALGTPRLLTVSGVGAPFELQKLGVKKIIESHAVGSDLQDHICWVGYIMLSRDMRQLADDHDCLPAKRGLGTERIGIFLNIDAQNRCALRAARSHFGTPPPVSNASMGASLPLDTTPLKTTRALVMSNPPRSRSELCWARCSVFLEPNPTPLKTDEVSSDQEGELV